MRNGIGIPKRLWLIALAGLLFILTGCGSVDRSAGTNADTSEPPPATATDKSPKEAEVKITVRMPWLPSAQQLPFYLALDKGYYKEVGLDVEVLDGKGSSSTVQTVGNYQDSFGFADMSVMALAVSKGTPIRSVAGFFKNGVFGIASNKSLDIREPKDLAGRTILHTPQSVETILLPAFFKLHGLEGKVQMRAVSPASKITDYVAGKADMVATDLPADLPMFTDKRPSNLMMFADHGLVMPSYGLFTTKRYIEEHPDIVRKFVQASLRGLQATMDDPGAAVKAMMKYREGFDNQKDMERQWELYQNYLETENTKGKPLGWQSEKDWQEALQILQKYAELEGSTNPADYFTNEFLN